MHVVKAALLLLSFATVAVFGGCVDDAIGQPCTFSWPVADFSGDEKTDCTDLPRCHPLEEGAPGADPTRQACPVDCIQLPSLECTNLICVATQVDEGPDAYKHVNGRCAADVPRTECLGGSSTTEEGQADWGCSGYCTKECLSDASCPKGYRCAPMAPFGDNLGCDVEEEWDTECTDTCCPAGTRWNGTECEVPSTGDEENICPESGGADPNYAVCDYEEYAKCCTCICYRFCPLLTKKFCRKVQWDEDMFPDGVVDSSVAQECQQGD